MDLEESQVAPLTIENVLEFEKHAQEYFYSILYHRVANARAKLAKEEVKFNDTIKEYKKISYADPMELAKLIIIERKRAAISIQV